MDEEVKSLLRKYKSNISISGVYVILYSIWITFKFFLSIAYGTENIYDIVGVDESVYDGFKYFLIGAVILVFLISILFHVRIGLGAVKFSKVDITSKKKIRKGFLVWAIIYALFSILGLFNYNDKFSDSDTIDTIIVAVVLDMTLIFLLLDMIYSSFKVLKIKKELNS